MQVGDVIRLRTFRHYPINSRVRWSDYTAETGQVFVCVLLGTESKDGAGVLDPIQALLNLGYVPIRAADEQEPRPSGVGDGAEGGA